MRFRCYNCRDYSRKGVEFKEFEADAPSCPHCGAQGPPTVLQLTDVHFLLADVKGQMPGSDGRRWRLACSPKRDHYAETLGPGAVEEFSCTPYPPAVTCPSCRGVPEWQAMMRALKDPVARQMLQEIAQGCCCG